MNLHEILPKYKILSFIPPEKDKEYSRRYKGRPNYLHDIQIDKVYPPNSESIFFTKNSLLFSPRAICLISQIRLCVICGLLTWNRWKSPMPLTFLRESSNDLLVRPDSSVGSHSCNARLEGSVFTGQASGEFSRH